MTNPTYGNPILPPCDSQTQDILTGKFGRLQVRALPEADTFALFYLANALEDRPELIRGWTMLCCHPNGHSCKELATRIRAAWDEHNETRAIEQFDYILQCGGLGRSLETVLMIVRGQY